MDNIDDIPPELSEIDERLTAGRPVAGEPALQRVMTRAQGARSRRLPSLLSHWRAPRRTRRLLGVALATTVAVAGSTGVAAAVIGLKPVDVIRVVTPDLTQRGTGSSGGGSDSQVQRNAASSQYCPTKEELQEEIAELQRQLQEELRKPRPNPGTIRRITAEIRRVAQEIEECYGDDQP